MNAKHTPGPWGWDRQILVRFDPSASVGDELEWDDVVLATLDDLDLAQDFIDGGGRDYCDWSVNEANARLIAAAPDLLDALEAAIECGMVPTSTAKEGGATAHARQVHVADQIRAAIAKARGEA